MIAEDETRLEEIKYLLFQVRPAFEVFNRAVFPYTTENLNILYVGCGHEVIMIDRMMNGPGPWRVPHKYYVTAW